MTSWASVFIRRTVASVVLVWVMSAASASANPILSINPATTTVNVGDTFTLNIDIAGVDDLFSYNFDLAFDPSILEFQGISEGSFLQNAGSAYFIEGDGLTTPGIVSFTTSAMFDPPGAFGSGTLAIATFVAVMAGETWITFPHEFPHEFLFADSSCDPQGICVPIAFDAINPGFVQVNASAVPETPSTMILLVAAVALAGCRSFTRAL